MLEGQKKELQQLQHQINLLRMKNSEKEDLIRKLDGDSTEQEAYKGEIQCPVLPNQICFLTNHNKFHVADLQLLLLSSNQKQWFTGNGTSNVVFTLSHS